MLKKALALITLLCTVACVTAVDLNLATEAELDSIKGVGPDTSGKILRAREQAPFEDWADLMNRVKGIRAQKAAQLSRDGANINGAPYPTPAPERKP